LRPKTPSRPRTPPRRESGARAAAGVLKEFLIRDRLITLAINGPHLCLVVALTNFCMLALFLPLIKLMETMGQG